MVILDGEIAFRSGETEFTSTAGTTVFLPHGTPHTFQVLSESARFSTITAATNGHPRFDRMVDTLGEPTPAATLPDPVEIDPGQVAAACGAKSWARRHHPSTEVPAPPSAPDQLGSERSDSSSDPVPGAGSMSQVCMTAQNNARSVAINCFPVSASTASTTYEVRIPAVAALCRSRLVD
jgi:hypothetical protein